MSSRDLLEARGSTTATVAVAEADPSPDRGGDDVEAVDAPALLARWHELTRRAGLGPDVADNDAQVRHAPLGDEAPLRSILEMGVLALPPAAADDSNPVTDYLTKNAAEERDAHASPSKHRLTTVALHLLFAHPLNAQLYPSAHTLEDDELEQDIRRHGIRRPLEACGDDCASPHGTLLAGHRRWCAARALGLGAVEVVFRNELTADQERWHLLLDDRRDQRGRILRPSELHAMEEQLRELHGRRQGQRSDLHGATSVTINASSTGRRDDTNVMLAKLTGEKSSAIKNRRTVFQSPLVNDTVRRAVDHGSLPLSRVASGVRRHMRNERTKKAVEAKHLAEVVNVQLQLERELQTKKAVKLPLWITTVKSALSELEKGSGQEAATRLRDLLRAADDGRR